MPKYRSRSRSRAAREHKRIRAQVPRDRRKIGHWAVRGTAEDYKKLREHAARHASARPSYVTDRALDLLQNASRRKMLEATRRKTNI